MNVHTAKLDPINWLVHLNDETRINMLQSIKQRKQDAIDTLINEYNDLQQLLDKRLEEKTADFVDARSSLNKVRHRHGI